MTGRIEKGTSRALLILAALAISACSSQPPRGKPGPTVRTAPAARAPAAALKGDADQRFTAALALMKEGRQQEAQAAFLALSQDFPQFSGALTDLGILYAQAGERDQALASFSKAVAANPRNSVALNWLGTLYRESGDFARAEQSYRAALALRPDYAAAHLNLGILYDVSLRRPQQALVQYRNYLKYAGKENLIVQAWIKELEASLNGSSVAVTAVASGAAP